MSYYSLFSQDIKNFIETGDHETWPEGLRAINLNVLKQRLLGSIAVIAAVDALAWYLDLEKEADTAKLSWVALFPLVFAVAMLILELADQISGRAQRS
jgi:uncharacterized membrane protein YqhA